MYINYYNVLQIIFSTNKSTVVSLTISLSENENETIYKYRTLQR